MYRCCLKGVGDGGVRGLGEGEGVGWDEGGEDEEVEWGGCGGVAGVGLGKIMRMVG